MDKVTLELLAAFPDQFEKLYEIVPGGYEDWAPSSWDGIPSETLTAIEQICHVRDIEIDGYHVRFRRALEEVNPALESLDTYSLAKERRYSGENPESVLRAFRNARAETLELLSKLTKEQSRRTATFDGYGLVSVKGLAHYLCSHDQQHLAGLQWLLGKMEAEIRPQ